ncbi:HNH endonuclease [Flavobacterium sp.]
MKICIWCLESEKNKFFNDLAHSIPKSLGGKNICKNVCDECNHYFGNIIEQLPSIEETIKEVLYIPRVIFLGKERIGKNKALARIKSTYFNIDVQKGKISLKTKFSLKKEFQTILCRQFKRGIYKIFLEEFEINKNAGLDSKFDFIRSFAKENIGDLPVFYFNRKVPIIVHTESMIINPCINFEYKIMDYLIQNDVFFEFELLGQVFGIVKDNDWLVEIESYIAENKKIKKDIFNDIIFINKVTDIDFSLKLFNE